MDGLTIYWLPKHILLFQWMPWLAHGPLGVNAQSPVELELGQEAVTAQNLSTEAFHVH